MARLFVYLACLAGSVCAVPAREALAKCITATYVVTGSLDVPADIRRVGVSVFLDDYQESRLVYLETPAAQFEIPVRYDTYSGQRFFIFGDECLRTPRQVEVVITDGEHLVFRKRFSEKEISKTDASDPRRIDLGHIRLRPPACPC